jgi:DNA replication protein DnaC
MSEINEINEINEKCATCGITGESVTTLPFDLTPICQKCSDERDMKIKEDCDKRERVRYEKYFNERCPKTMQQFDRDRFPSDLENYDAIIAAPLTEKGITINGITGAGKSRTMWQLAKRLITQDHKYVQILEDRCFGRMIECSYNKGMGAHDELIRQFQCCDVLMIDDLGKAKMTGRIESDLFDIIDHRYAEGKLMVITTQFTGGTLLRRFICKETGAAIVRRIKEVNKGFCLSVAA